jgi:hypothetical protein
MQVAWSCDAGRMRLRRGERADGDAAAGARMWPRLVGILVDDPA